MAGFGFVRDAVDRMKSNRSLLKGSSKYNNFDTSYITDYKVSKSKKKLNYKRATKLQLLKIRKKLLAEQKELNVRKVYIFAFSATLVGVLAYWIFW